MPNLVVTRVLELSFHQNGNKLFTEPIPRMSLAWGGLVECQGRPQATLLVREPVTTATRPDHADHANQHARKPRGCWCFGCVQSQQHTCAGSSVRLPGIKTKGTCWQRVRKSHTASMSLGHMGVLVKAPEVQPKQNNDGIWRGELIVIFRKQPLCFDFPDS